MIDLSGVARHLRLSVEQIRVAADLLEQGYQPSFIERYRADESGNLPRATLWLLKLEVDRQIRLQAARDKAANQLPRDTELDAEGKNFIEKATTEVEIEAALRAFRSRRLLSQNQESDKQASQLLEKMIEYQGPAIDDLTSWAAAQLSVDNAVAEVALQHASRLVGMLMNSDSNLNEALRRSVQRHAELRVELCDPTHGDAHAADDDDGSANHESSDSASEETDGSEISAAATGPAPEAADVADAKNSENALPAASPVTDEHLPVADGQHPEEEPADAQERATEDPSASPAASSDTASIVASEVPEPLPEGVSTAEDSSVSDDSVVAAELVFTQGGKRSEKKLGKGGKSKASKPAKKPVAKMTPRQRRRRWLIAMLQPMKSLKRPLSKLSSYQHLMLGRGRRSQLVKTELSYDRGLLVGLARDTFVADKHPLAKWFTHAAQEALEHSLRAKVEMDAVTDLEEIAAERLLETSVDQLHKSLMQRPVRGHCILVVDAVGPKAAAVAVVSPTGKVLAVEEIPCSASPGIVNQNVVRLGELVHQHRVTLVALTNGPARRFLVLSLRELVSQSASSGLRWTMADRSGADAYAVGRSALKELSAHNRRHRAAIWIGRCLQDPLSELLKVDVNRLRLGSFQRELPQEPLKKLVRETIADCVCQRGINTLEATHDQLQFVPGVSGTQAQQIFNLAACGDLTSRKQLLEQLADWPESQSRQAIGLLRIFGGDQPLDATTIHPEDYRLAERLIENTELSLPPNAPPGWVKPQPASAAETLTVPATLDVSEQSAPAESTVPESSAESALEPADSSPSEATEQSPEDQAASASSASASSEEAIDVATEEQQAAVDQVAVDSTTVDPAAADPVDATQVSEEPVSDEQVAVESTQAVSDGPAVQASGERGAEATSTIKPEYPEDLEPQSITPPTVDVEKLARGWQVGREKLRWVASCLNDPFADPRLSQPPVPLMSEMPTLTNLQPGMCVWAIVIGVADFGAFVELAPDCSGLIHISRLSANYVEDPHQCVQVGDLVMAWVVSVDEKKNRVALTALSPAERAAADALASARRTEQDGNRRRDRGGAGAGGQRTAGAGGNQGESGHNTARAGQGQGRNQSRGGGGNRGGGHSRGGSQPSGRGRGRAPQSKTVVVTSKKPKANITDAMKEGDEPLRSFSDLMQFYEAKRTDEPPTQDAAETKND